MSEIVREKLSDDALEGATGGAGKMSVVLKDKKTGNTITKVITTGTKSIKH
ncbi:MAG: hypothetical protein IJR07_02860 [Bacteroidaceae bacterium]|nr:hypothetical protein [Bacteroidaceae bacterium]